MGNACNFAADDEEMHFESSVSIICALSHVTRATTQERDLISLFHFRVSRTISSSMGRVTDSELKA